MLPSLVKAASKEIVKLKAFEKSTAEKNSKDW